MSIVPSTGSPSQPRFRMSLHAARLVVPHVLIDRQRNSRPLAQFDNLDGLGVTHGQRLLRENSADVVGVLATSRMIAGWNCGGDGRYR